MVNWKQHDLERARKAAMLKELQLRDLKALREREDERHKLGRDGKHAAQDQGSDGEEARHSG